MNAPVPKINYELTFNEFMRSDEYVWCYIFECEGKPCGFAMLSKTFSQEAGGHSVTVEEIYIDEENDWEAYTADGKPSAQWEIMVLVTEDGAEVLCW